MSQIILKTEDLTKVYGRLRAVDKLNLEIQAGQVFGILGPNGSGKTTTLAMILGVINSTEGRYSWFEQGDDYQLRKKIGSILEHPIFYPYMTAVQNLEIVCMIKGVDKKRINEVLDLVGLIDRKNDPFKTYSLGMKQRLAIGSALLANPEVLIFDEPTNGLDPMGIAQIRELIIEIAGWGKTIILASHLLDEVQKVCTHFGVMRLGNLIHSGPVQLDSSDTNKILLKAEDNKILIQTLESFDVVQHIRTLEGKIEITVPGDLSANTINKKLMDQGISLDHLSMVNKTLEEQFLEILDGHA